MKLGPELITNGGFDDETGWNLGEAWSIGGGKAVFVSRSPDPVGTIVQNNVVSPGKTYRVTFTLSDIENIGAGVILFAIPGGQSGTLRTENGTYTQDISVTRGTNFSFIGDAIPGGGTFSIDDVSVREVLPSGGLSAAAYQCLMADE